MRFLLFFIISQFIAFETFADDGEILVSSSVCESSINSESKSSVRVRASDKALFKAVEEIPSLMDYKSKLNVNDFNLLIYKLVDDYLEDVTINTISQNHNTVCVEVKAKIMQSAINKVFSAPQKTIPEALPTLAEIEEQEELELLNDTPKSPITLNLPPKPNIVINKNISYDANSAVSDNTSESFAQNSAEKSKATRVFVDKTEFFNDTSTQGFFSHIEKNLMTKSGIKVIASLNEPDYILKSKVLKAKVDNINSSTKRLQIVISLDLTDVSNSKTITEHQNKFVLLNSDEDTQKSAAALIKKLMSAGLKKLLPAIKTQEVQTSGNSIITPQK